MLKLMPSFKLSDANIRIYAIMYIVVGGTELILVGKGLGEKREVRETWTKFVLISINILLLFCTYTLSLIEATIDNAPKAIYIATDTTL